MVPNNFWWPMVSKRQSEAHAKLEAKTEAMWEAGNKLAAALMGTACHYNSEAQVALADWRRAIEPDTSV